MISVFRPIISGKELKNLNQCLKDKWFSSGGKFNLELEKKFNKLTNRKFSSCVSNGTVALELALRSLNIKPGSEVIVPSFTIISPILAIIRNNLKPVLVDSENKNWSMCTDDIERKINNKTKAIIVVHTYGFPADMDKIIKLKKKFNLYLIEDAAEMHGQTYKKKPCGSFGEISTFSLYSNKFISCGEGGIICTDDKKIKERIDALKNLSFGKLNKFKHTELGYNYRLSNLQAAVACAQVENLKKIVKKKREIGRAYNSFFEKNKDIKILPYKNKYSTNIYWVYGILLNTKKIKDKLVKYLKKNGIETRDFFVCMHNQPILKKMYIIKNKNCIVADYLEEKGIYIPSGPDLNINDIEFVAKKIINFLKRD
jgi:perosamine synthetase